MRRPNTLVRRATASAVLNSCRSRRLGGRGRRLGRPENDVGLSLRTPVPGRASPPPRAPPPPGGRRGKVTAILNPPPPAGGVGPPTEIMFTPVSATCRTRGND